MIQIHKSFLIYLCHNVRDAACGRCGSLYTLRCLLHCAAKILYELCLIGFHRRTKPSKLAIHGSISPCLGISVYHAHNSTVSKQLRYSRTPECIQTTAAPASSVPYYYHYNTTVSMKQYSHSRGLPAGSVVLPSLRLLCRQPVFHHTRVNSVSSHSHPAQTAQNKYFSYSSAFRYS